MPTVKSQLSIEDIGEMSMAATASVGLFPRIEIDPAHAVELCRLAAEALRVREQAATYGHQLGCSCHEEDGSGCDCVLDALGVRRS